MCPHCQVLQAFILDLSERILAAHEVLARLAEKRVGDNNRKGPSRVSSR